MPAKDSIAAVLRLVRSARKLKIDRLVGVGGVEARHMHYLEAGKVIPTPETLAAVATALNVDPISLLVLATSFEANLSPAKLLSKVQGDIEELRLLGVTNASFADQFEDGHLIARPGGKQMNQEKLAAVLACKEQGMSQSETARKLEMSATTVRRYWLKS